MKRLLLLLAVALTTHLSFGQKKNPFTIIPQPVDIVLGKGFLKIEKPIAVFVEDNNQQNLEAANLFLELAKSFYGFDGFLTKEREKKGVIILKTNLNTNYKPEGYSLKVTKKNIVIEGDASGILYGLQTLFQLMQKDGPEVKIACCSITDYPAFKWRGLHLDVCRHFFPVSFVKKYIDYLAMYKMNTFHWHLTDDQGWRIEIKKYPKLTEIGAWRNSTLIGHYSDMPHRFDSTRYGGFYTQDEIREVVAYAAKRHITIVPEIEMPGHALAALAAYPELSCTGGPFEVSNLWGVFDDVFCTKEETFTFLENVLSEVIDLFPSKIIHIGGDECPKERWKTCPVCQQRIKDEGLKDEFELQSYFIHRIEKFVNSKGRSIIGWDEILEGGLAPNAAVMSWRGTEGGIAAAKAKHNVVMTPGSHCYFDYYQGNPITEPLAIGGYITVEKVYQFDPIPAELNEEEKQFILGAQGNVWTEYIGTEKQVEYMIFPRMTALSEVLWTYPKDRNFDQLKPRLLKHFEIWDKLGINYSKALFELKMDVQQGQNEYPIQVVLTGSPDTDIRYSLDGTEISAKSTKYSKPVEINNECTLMAGSFRVDKLSGPVLAQKFNINLATGKPIKLVNPPHEKYNQGGAFTLVDGIIGRMPWYGAEWLGFSGTNCEATIDLEKETKINKVKVDVLNAEYSWIYLPVSVELLISNNGLNFSTVRKLSKYEIESMNREMILEANGVSARYIKVIIQNLGKIPDGKPGATYDAWLFVDEISVE